MKTSGPKTEILIIKNGDVTLLYPSGCPLTKGSSGRFFYYMKYNDGGSNFPPLSLTSFLLQAISKMKITPYRNHIVLYK